MALVLAIQHWRHYLLGCKFLVITDHKPLRNLLQQRISTTDQQYWLAKLLRYEFEIKHKAGVNNGASDALSQREETGRLHALTKAEWMEEEEIKDAICKDPELRKIIQKLNMAGGSDNHCSLVNGCLLYKGRVVRTYKRLASSFFWQGTKRDVCKFEAGCVVRQK